MKSKSFDLNQAQTEIGKSHKTFDFVGLYKSESDTSSNLTEKRKSDDRRANGSSKSKYESPKRERSPNKNKKKRKNEPVDISHNSIEGSHLNSSIGASTGRNDPRITSTPLASVKTSTPVCKVKSIMKTTIVNEDDTMDGTKTVIHKPKKRNKSVSFMLDDNDEVIVKRTKSDDSISKKKVDAVTKHKAMKDKKKQLKNLKKERLSGKENKVGDVNQNVDKLKEKIRKKNLESDIPSESSTTEQTETREKKKKVKKAKKVEESTQSNTETEQPSEPKHKKVKKTKHQTKYESEEEPVNKSQKKDIKPDVIAEDLENLSIGDNAHTLSSLLDEMTVADKSKRIKTKSKHKQKQNTVVDNKPLPNEAEKEKVKWKKRKWNKDKKGVDIENVATSVIVENLPISIMLTYKKILAEHFEQCGLIKNIGLAELYPMVESSPVFTTTINFYSDGAATQALEKDYMCIEGRHIRVKRPLPATETTIVLRTYGELTEQSVCSLLAGAGRIRSVRHIVKGRNAISTAFVEMDGPESVKKALKIATGTKVAGKKIYVNKFEKRSHKKPKNEEDKTNEKDSDDSND